MPGEGQRLTATAVGGHALAVGRSLLTHRAPSSSLPQQSRLPQDRRSMTTCMRAEAMHHHVQLDGVRVGTHKVLHRQVALLGQAREPRQRRPCPAGLVAPQPLLNAAGVLHACTCRKTGSIHSDRMTQRLEPLGDQSSDLQRRWMSSRKAGAFERLCNEPPQPTSRGCVLSDRAHASRRARKSTAMTRPVSPACSCSRTAAAAALVCVASLRSSVLSG